MEGIRSIATRVLNWRLAAVLASLVAAHPTNAADGLELAESLDLERYQGKWYEIARLPNRFQDQCQSNVTAHYRLRSDGRVAVTNRCRLADGETSRASGVARRADPDGPEAALEVRFAPGWLSFLPFVWGDYRVIALADDYSHALVGSQNREYLWMLSREPDLEEVVFDRLVAIAKSQGFDVENLQRTEHGS